MQFMEGQAKQSKSFMVPDPSSQLHASHGSKPLEQVKQEMSSIVDIYVIFSS